MQRRTRHVASRGTASLRIEEVQKSFLGSPARTIRDSLLLFRMPSRPCTFLYKLQRGLYVALYEDAQRFVGKFSFRIVSD